MVSRAEVGRPRSPLWGFLGLALASGVFGMLVGVMRSRGDGAIPVGPAVMKGFAVGVAISLAMGGLEMYAFRRLFRRLPLWGAILVRTVVYPPVVLGVFAGISAAFAPRMPASDVWGMLVPVMGIAVGAFLVGGTVLTIVRLIGGRVLLNLLSGRYHHPREEERIFLFLDLVGSTTLAEKLGALRFHRLLNDFYVDLAGPIRATGGEVNAYVGDEIIVTWPLRDPGRNRRCLECYFGIVTRMRELRPRYEREYGVVPGFRVGIHGGAVVAGEVGEHRRQVVFLGDVVNTASRVQAECKARERDLIVTRDLLDRVALPEWVEVAPLGRARLRGKEQELELCAVAERVAAAA
jgi:adenylate cyclase